MIIVSLLRSINLSTPNQLKNKIKKKLSTVSGITYVRGVLYHFYVKDLNSKWLYILIIIFILLILVLNIHRRPFNLMQKKHITTLLV